MKGVSIARARYNFSARDRSELSLQEGDTIKILSKKGHNGWWKGEVYGRVCGLMCGKQELVREHLSTVLLLFTGGPLSTQLRG